MATEKEAFAAMPDAGTLERVETYVSKLEAKKYSLDSYQKWVEVGLALADLGENGRVFFHRTSSHSEKYTPEATDAKFDELLRSRRDVHIGSFFHFVQEALHEEGAGVPIICRVADRYYERTTSPEGDVSWNIRVKAELSQDGIKCKDVPAFAGFTVKHDFLNYQPICGRWLNLSQPIPWTPSPGKFSTIEQLFAHIFGDQLQWGYDRYSLLVKKPEQAQPILVLCSNQQGTGKSTMLSFDKMLFGCNAITLNISEFAQPFNALFASKLLIGVDESVISEAFVKERLKMLSTAKTIQLRKMYCEHQTLPFFGKIVMATNRETDFAKLEKNDLRFWVRRVPQVERFDARFLDKIREEIPAFLNFLITRPMAQPVALSRLWFSPQQLETAQLDIIKLNSRSDCAKDICEWAEDTFAQTEKTEFYAAATEVWNALNRRYPLNLVTRSMREELELTNRNLRYSDLLGYPRNGRAYIFNKEMQSAENQRCITM